MMRRTFFWLLGVPIEEYLSLWETQRVNEITAVNHAGMFWARDLIPCDLYVFLSVCQRYTERHNWGHKLVGRRI